MAEADSRKARCIAIGAASETLHHNPLDPLHAFATCWEGSVSFTSLAESGGGYCASLPCPVEKAQMRSILRMLCYVSLG